MTVLLAAVAQGCAADARAQEALAEAVEDTKAFFQEEVATYRAREVVGLVQHGPDMRDLWNDTDFTAYSVEERMAHPPDRYVLRWWTYRIYSDEPGVRYGEPDDCVESVRYVRPTLYGHECNEDEWWTRTMDPPVTIPNVPEEIGAMEQMELARMVGSDSVRGTSVAVYEGTVSKADGTWDYVVKVDARGVIRSVEATGPERQTTKHEWWDFNAPDISIERPEVE